MSSPEFVLEEIELKRCIGDGSAGVSDDSGGMSGDYSFLSIINV